MATVRPVRPLSGRHRQSNLREKEEEKENENENEKNLY
jgi:hypothetical protein